MINITEVNNLGDIIFTNKEEKEMSVKGYKVFDENWNTKNKFHWTVGETYTHEGELKICESGFHFCKRLSDLSRYIPITRVDHFIIPDSDDGHTNAALVDFTRVHIAEVEALGTVLDDEEKSVTDKIHIIREIPTSELLDIMNIGKYNYGVNNTGENNLGNGNSGSYNVGHANAAIYCLGSSNTGDRNVGYHNSGHDNMGYFNTGNGNLGDYNNGMWCKGNHIPNGSLFCTNNDETFKVPNEIRVFNKVISANEINIDLVKMVTETTIDMVAKAAWFEHITMLRATMLYPFYYEVASLIDSVLSLTTWIPEDKMSDKEKEQHPYYSYTKGYLLVHEYEDMWKEFWEDPSDNHQRVKDIIMALPGFDPAIFKEITGIEV